MDSSSPACLMRTGTLSSPASRAALSLLSPAMSSKPPGVGRTTRGCNIPTSFMEAASSRIPASGKLVLGWREFGRIADTGNSSNFSPPTLSPVAMRAERPRPKPLLPTVHNLVRNGRIGLGSCALRRVEDYGHPEAGGFAQPYVPRDYGVEDAFSEEGTYFVGHLMGQVRAWIEHRQEHPADLETGVQFLPDHPDALHELGESFERVVLALYRDESLISGGQRVECQEIQGRRTVEQHPIVRRQFLQRPLELEFPRQARDQLDLGPDQVDGGRRDLKPFDLCLHSHVPQGFALEQNVVHASARTRRHAEPAGGIPLRVHVDHENSFALPREISGQVDGGRALANTAFLVHYGYDSPHRGHLSTSFVRVAQRTPRGLLVTIPGRRGYRAGVSPVFSRITRFRSFSPTSGSMGTLVVSVTFAPSASSALLPSASSSGSSRPFMAMAQPPVSRSGAQYSATTDNRATALQVTTSYAPRCPPARPRSSTLVFATSTPLRERPPTACRKKLAFLPVDSTRVIARSGLRIFIGMPGRPPPLPTSAKRQARKSGSCRKQLNESSTWSIRILSTSLVPMTFARS